MKKSLLLAVILCLLTVGLFAAQPRIYTQVLVDGNGNQFPDVENTSASHNPNYILRAWVTARPTEVTSTETHHNSQIRVFRFGNGSPAVPYATATSLNFGAWETEWTSGETVHMELTRLGDLREPQVQTWEIVIPPGVLAIGHRQIDNPFPDGIVCDFWPAEPEFTLTVRSNYVGAAIHLDGADTGQVTPYIFDPAEAGTYTLVMPNVSWNPADYVYTAEADGMVEFFGTITPDVAGNPYPADGETLMWPDGETLSLNLSWDPVAGADYYNVYWNGATEAEVAGDPTWATPIIGEGTYTWQVVPYITDPAMPYKAARRGAPVATRVNNNASIKGGAVGAPVWTFTIEYEVVPPVPVLTITSLPTGAEIWLNGVDTGLLTPNTVTDAGTYTLYRLGYTFTPAQYVWDGLTDDSVEFVAAGTQVLTITSDPTEARIFLNGVATLFLTPSTVSEHGIYTVQTEPYLPYIWTPAQFEWDGEQRASIHFVGELPQEEFTLTVTSEPTGAAIFKDGLDTGQVTPYGFINEAGTYTVFMANYTWTPVDYVWDGLTDAAVHFVGEDSTLPVELSSFNAVLTAQKFVQLTWISESESNMMGYRVYRNENQDAATAALITPVMIPATNTSTTQVYNLTDREVSGGTTYYYWLEAADYGHSIMYGPQYVEVTVDATPELPVQSAMKNAYPNPFKANSNTNIDVSVKAGEKGTVTIFNVLGQVVQTYRVGEGSHNLKWNGTDTRGNTCGSGIYFYKLSTPSMNQTKKMVIVK